MGFFSNSKDRVIEKMVLPVLNTSVLQPYGRASNLRLDSTAKSVELDLDLNGEAAPLKIQIGKYEMIQEGDESFVIIREFTASRAWLTVLAAEHLLHRRLPLPPKAAAMLLRFL